MKRFLYSTRNLSTRNAGEIVKQFKEMPGPKGIFGIGNFYNYMKIFGNRYSLDELHKNAELNYNKYGPIVHEKMLPGVNLVHVFDPDDIAEVFRQDSPTNLPSRRSHLGLQKYRKDRPEIYRTGGLLPSNGEEWWKIRSELQKGLSMPKNVREFLPKADETVKDFVNYIPKRFDENGKIDDFIEDLSRLSLELLCLLAFDERLNSFSDEEIQEGSLSTRLIKASSDANSKIFPIDQSFLWRFFETSDYKILRQSLEFLEKISVELIAKKASSSGDGNSLLDQYLRNQKLDKKDLYGMAGDLFLGGIDTTSFTTSYALYHISKDQRVQDLMFEEAKKVLPDVNSPITPSIMNSEIPYTRAVLKEVLRLNPISIGVGRILNQNMVLGGYQVPKNTVIVTQNYVACRLEKNFPEPMKFFPERWLKSSEFKQNNVHPYLVLPFGHGMRSCIARRFAEQNMLLTLLRIMRSYKIEWKGDSETLKFKTFLINHPVDKVTLRFTQRNQN